MEIDLNLLKFHSFKLNKSLHNEVVKNNWNYFENIFFKFDHCLQNVLNSAKQAINPEEFKEKFLHYHEIKDKKLELVRRVIRTCHPNLKNDLDQKFEMTENIKFFQLKLDKPKRLVFVLYKNLKGQIIFAPILLDLNHVFYEAKDRNFDNNISSKTLKKWDFKDKQTQIKQDLLNA